MSSEIGRDLEIESAQRTSKDRSSSRIDYSKLIIVPDPDTAEWWAGARQHKYLVRQCAECGHKWFPPLPACSNCTSMKLDWFETRGTGIIHGYAVVTQPILAAFTAAVPYIIGLIDLDDCLDIKGLPVRVKGVVLNSEDEVGIGLPVRTVFEITNDPNIVVPHWKVSGDRPGSWRFTEK